MLPVRTRWCAGPMPAAALSAGRFLARVLWSAAIYAYLPEHLASYGFVVMAIELRDTGSQQPATRDADFDVHAAARCTGRSTTPKSSRPSDGDPGGLIDTEQVAVVGHSYGGDTALMAGGAQSTSTGRPVVRLRQTSRLEIAAAARM